MWNVSICTSFGDHLYIFMNFPKITVVVRTAATCSNSAHKLITLNLMALRTFWLISKMFNTYHTTVNLFDHFFFVSNTCIYFNISLICNSFFLFFFLHCYTRLHESQKYTSIDILINKCLSYIYSHTYSHTQYQYAFTI